MFCSVRNTYMSCLLAMGANHPKGEKSDRRGSTIKSKNSPATPLESPDGTNPENGMISCIVAKHNV